VLRLAQAETLRASEAVQHDPLLTAQASAQSELTKAQLRAWPAPLVPPALAAVID
jgi:hypothetical protein